MKTTDTTSQSTRQAKQHKKSYPALVVSTAVVVIVAVALIVLIGQNTGQVTFGFLGWESSFPLSVGLVAATLGGAIVAFALAGLMSVRRSRR
ncbi:LapA family protein [Corynebacterium sp.]|uniref:LapA family protein n=1 Tax=Corynebacterium sp. TaxID=1720 RepID=UPI0028B1D949|nr:LapA family protein [Corynebacterium sp.]